MASLHITILSHTVAELYRRIQIHKDMTDNMDDALTEIHSQRYYSHNTSHIQPHPNLFALQNVRE